MKDTHQCLHGLVGSRLYGTQTEKSDYDWMTVQLGTVRSYLLGGGPISNQEQETSTYEFRFFVKLCLNANLNTLPLLWSHDLEYSNGGNQFCEAAYEAGSGLIRLRNKFLSQKLRTTGIGFATRCIMDAENIDRPTEKLGAVRKELIERFGFDTKAAMHALRLARMTKEYIFNPEEGLNVMRTKDAEELLAVRDGKVSLVDVGKQIRSIFKEVDTMSTCKAPAEPDRVALEDFVCDVISSYLAGSEE